MIKDYYFVQNPQVVIVGAGISGLAAALKLEAAGISWVMLEKSDAPGGRIRTVMKGGFTLDVGFQVLHPNYPEIRNCGIWDNLQVSGFLSGALFSKEKNLVWYGNPFLNPIGFIKNGFALPFPLREYPAAIRLFGKALQTDEDFQLLQSSGTSMEFLRNNGFSDQTIRNFFVPFFGGVFLDSELGAGEQYLLWLLKKFMQGKPGLPFGGMQALPLGLASGLPANSQVYYNSSVKGIEDGKVFCTDGRIFQPSYIVDASGLRNRRLSFRSTKNIYLTGPAFASLPSALILNGNQSGGILHFCFPSAVQRSYAPDGYALCSVTLRNPDASPEPSALRKELQLLYPKANWNEWSVLETFHIQRALPAHQSGPRPLFHQNGSVFSCGDTESYPSINGAYRSGREAAEEIIRRLNAQKV